jgi:GNAT superfamily N-acetyltransferase
MARALHPQRLIRPATPSDEAFLLALTERLAAFPVPPWRTAAEIARADDRILLEALRHPGPETLLLVAEQPPGEPAGGVFVTSETDYFTGKASAHIEIVAVTPEAVGTSLGRALMEEAERWARSRGYGQITLNVFERNEQARRFYDRLGYRPETMHYWKGLDADRP